VKKEDEARLSVEWEGDLGAGASISQLRNYLSDLRCPDSAPALPLIDNLLDQRCAQVLPVVWIGEAMNRASIGLVVSILLISCVSQVLAAGPSQGHVVGLEELQGNLAADSSQRQAHIEQVRKMLRHQLVQEQVGRLVDLEKIEAGIGSLDDETLAQLAEQSQEVNDQIGAGVSSWVIIIAVSVALLVILLLI